MIADVLTASMAGERALSGQDCEGDASAVTVSGGQAPDRGRRV